MKFRAIIKPSKEKMFLNYCGGMFIFSLCKAILQNKRFANITGGDFLNTKNGGESKIQR